MNDYEKHTITTIENVNIFRNVVDASYNSCTMIFRDENWKPFLLYIEKINQEMSLNTLTEWLPRMLISTNKEFSLEAKIFPSNNVVFRIVDLSFEPEVATPMTKEEIEKVLGYKINIVKEK